MKVAVFTGTNEVIVLAIKGQKKSVESIDGFYEFFGKSTGRYVCDYDIQLAHVGAGEGLMIESYLKAEHTSRRQDIEEWFPEKWIHGDTSGNDVDY